MDKRKNGRPKGGKELGLIDLEKYAIKIGYKVPKYFVVDDLAESTLEVIAEHFDGQDVVVRSNSLAENGEIGFDGIYESVVVEKCNFEKLIGAYQRVMDSLNSERAILYRKKVGVENDSMRVIVQKFMGKDGMHYTYFVVETSVNPQGDICVAMSSTHDFINKEGLYYEKFFFNKEMKFIHGETDNTFNRINAVCVAMFGAELHEVFGPVQLEGVLQQEKSESFIAEPFFFQRRFLPKEIYQGVPEKVPEHYAENDILFRSRLYRGSGKFEHLPIIVMPEVSDGAIDRWEKQLKIKASQLEKKEFFLFVPKLNLGVRSSQILNDYACLEGVRTIISYEDISFASHAFKVASFAGLPFVSINGIHGNLPFEEKMQTLDKCSLFFTEDQAVFCLDEKHSLK